MNHINRKLHNHFSGTEPRNVTLEEIDLIARKCHHLHDEEILLRLSAIGKRLKKIFGKSGS